MIKEVKISLFLVMILLLGLYLYLPKEEIYRGYSYCEDLKSALHYCKKNQELFKEYSMVEYSEMCTYIKKLDQIDQRPFKDCSRGNTVISVLAK